MTVSLVRAPVLGAKFALPDPPPGLVRRQRLTGRLDRGIQGPLTLVTGAAGSGKTALVASWARSRASSSPVVWLSLDEQDTPQSFWAHAVEGLRRAGVPVGGDGGRGDGSDPGLPVRIAAALEELPAPLVLVLDGLDRVRGPDAASGLRFVVEHAGPAFRLVVIGRSEPALPLHRYRVEGRLAEIGGRELAFTRSEAARLLQTQGGRPPDERVVDLLLERTEGWAAGLRLCALAMARAGDPLEFAGSAAAARQAVSDYLLTEVLAVQPAASRELLLRAGVLGRVHPGLAAALTGRTDCEAVLHDLVRRHAFVEPVAGTRWFRVHPLFTAVLRGRLRSRQPALETLLHRRAARWYAAHCRTAEAVEEAAAGGEWPYAAAQAVRHLAVGPLLAGPAAAPPTAASPPTAAVPAAAPAEALARMPEHTPGAAAALVAAACCLARDDVAGCRARLPRAERELVHEPAAGPAELLTLELLRLLSAPGPAEADAAARRIAELVLLLPGEERARHPEIEPLCLYGRARALLCDGRIRAAREGLAEAVRACADGAPALLSRCLGRLALADAAAGALSAAEEHGTASLDAADRGGVPEENRSGAAWLALASVAVERGDLRTAAAHLDRAADHSDTLHDPVLAAERSALRAQLEVAGGRWHAALAVLDEPRPPGPPGAAARLAVAHAGAALAHGDHDTALTALRAVPEALPARTVLLAQAHLAAGQSAQALRLIERAEGSAEATLPDRVRLALLRAHCALLDGDEAAARDRLLHALDTARPELLRRPFAEAGPWLRHLAAGLNGHSSSYEWVTAAAPRAADGMPVEELSPREKEVLALVARMMSTEEVAAELRLSVNTVKTHMRGIFRKLGVSRRRDAVERARDLHVI
ncbi:MULTISPECIES: LuxR C-terminal-related transcriptional regulator [Streptomyces]|uniref:LuxR C-terminal-related transcriptional regulator n=1 Tax=Streptomyces TaxID=1883 RepID=UPI0016760C62|nr:MULTISPECIES: LuxR C-terminal-related transcriptional regulator [Streptomyces]MBD3578146.1 helix-turn-helix transcriptional regulator [Streptomyces sp. KD18]GGT29409.1 transcriptional regulator [Streptomyces toxytricini]